MKKILFFVLSFFIIFISSSFITKAAVSNASINIYTYNCSNSDEENSLFISSQYFTKNEIIIDDTEGNYTFSSKEYSGWTFKGYYQYINENYIYYDPSDTININELSNYDFYEYWEKDSYDFIYYIYYNKSDLPQEFNITGILTFEEFVSSFPTTYKNLTATSFKNSDGTVLSIDEIYDGYITSVSNGTDTYAYLYATYEVNDENIVNKNEIIEEEKTLLEWFKELDFEIKIMIIIIFILFIIMILSLFSGKRRYRKKW